MDLRPGSLLASFTCTIAAATLVAGCVGRASVAPRRTADVVTTPDGIPIAYETRGAGAPALVFVHGWSCDRSYWSNQLEPFSRDHRVVVIDLAGHGESGLGREAWTIPSFGGDVASVVEKLDLDSVVLVGHSMGGDVIVEAARRLPGRVVGLVWVDTYKRLGAPRTPEQVEAFAAPFRASFVETTRTFVRSLFPPTADPALAERVANDMASAPPHVAVPALESAFGFDREIPGALQELGLPVVAINPETPPTDVASMERHGVKVLLMPGVGHFLQMEDPPRFNALLREALDVFARPASARRT